jgi:hypothetical protein
MPDSLSVKWSYLYRRGPADDSTPTISITRTTKGYTLVSWDFVEFAMEGAFPEHCAQTIDGVLLRAQEIVSTFQGSGPQGRSDLQLIGTSQ